MFYKLQVNIRFGKALKQMSIYTKLMKELAKIIKLTHDDRITLNEDYSAIIQQMIPPKLKDLGSFIISCTIG